MEELLDGAEIVSASEHGLVAMVDGHEIHVSPTIDHARYRDAVAQASLDVMYNRPQDVDGDPLGIK